MAAFAPSAVSSRASALQMNYAKEAGAIAPLGFFDPLGLSKNIDKATFDYYRTAEVKHGRVAQLAVLGYVIPELFKFPGDISPGISFASVPNGVGALAAIPALGWLQIFFLIGAVDYRGFLVLGDTEAKDKTPEELAKAKNQELSNGRLAMLASLELLRHDSQNYVARIYEHLITGLPFLYK